MNTKQLRKAEEGRGLELRLGLVWDVGPIRCYGSSRNFEFLVRMLVEYIMSRVSLLVVIHRDYEPETFLLLRGPREQYSKSDLGPLCLVLQRFGASVPVLTHLAHRIDGSKMDPALIPLTISRQFPRSQELETNDFPRFLVRLHRPIFPRFPLSGLPFFPGPRLCNAPTAGFLSYPLSLLDRESAGVNGMELGETINAVDDAKSWFDLSVLIMQPPEHF